jgi:hypothetical protein
MSFRRFDEVVYRCCLCGYESARSADFEPHETITIRVLGEPTQRQLYRCRDHEACMARLPAQTDAAELEQRAAMGP